MFASSLGLNFGRKGEGILLFCICLNFFGFICNINLTKPYLSQVINNHISWCVIIVNDNHYQYTVNDNQYQK